MQNLTIAVDAMGGDSGPPVTIPAVKVALETYPHLTIKLFGDRHKLSPLLISYKLTDHARLDLIHSPQVVLAADKPLTALRSRKQSSMRMALDAVQCSEVDACVSAGNTGALMAMAKFVLKLLPGIERPALITNLPTRNGRHTLLLDLGANTSCSADVLVQFAIMGSALAESFEGIAKPKVAVLNIGEEQIKGNEVVKQAAAQLKSMDNINYSGFIEGDQLFDGEVDVVVCDGFVGNVALKTAEGVAHLILEQVKKQFSTGWLAKVLLNLLLPNLRASTKQLNPDQYNGASLLGLRGIVVKSHGKADENAFLQAIHQAVIEVTQQVPAKISQRLETLLINK